MEHVAAILFLVGCNDAAANCRELPAPVEAYETIDACQVDLPVASRLAARKAPLIYGACVSIDPALIYDNLEIVWDVSKAGRLDVTVHIDPPELLSVVAPGQTGGFGR